MVAREISEIDEEIRALIAGSSTLDLVYQPVLDLAAFLAGEFEMSHLEALSRFRSAPNPMDVFTRAAELGLGVDLELVVMRETTAQLPIMDGSCRLNVNATAQLLRSDELIEVIAPHAHRMTIDVAADDVLNGVEGIDSVIEELQELGGKIAIDDLTLSVDSIRLLTRMPHDLVKIDRSVVSGASTDTTRKRTVRSIVRMADAIGSTTIAEGIDNPDDLVAVVDLGVGLGQGYLLGEPGPIDAYTGLPQQ